MERDSARALAWQKAQDAATRQRLRSWPRREALMRRLELLLGARTSGTPRPGGDRWFAHSSMDGERALTVRDSPAGREHVLLGLGDTDLDWFFPSPDGRHVAVGRSLGGDEQSTLSIVDVERRQELHERIEHASFAGVAWLPDGSGFYYSAGTAPDTVDSRKHIWFHRLGEHPPGEPEPVRSRVPFCLPTISADGRYVACQPSEVEPRPDHVLDRWGDGGWRPFLAEFDGVFVGFFEGERFVAVTSDGAPHGRVVSIPVASPADRSAWVELIPESEAVLRGAVLVAGQMLVVSLVDAASRIALHELDGRLVTNVPLPAGPIGLDGGAWTCEPPVAAGRTQVSFTISSPTAAPVGYVYDIPRRRLTALDEPAVILERAVVTRVRSEGRGAGSGARAWLVHRRDLDLSTPQPVLLHAYGGWNAAFMPVWQGALAAFVDAGGVLALANLRGGGELGYDFWRAGRLAHKQHSYDDLYAIAEELIERGVTTLDRMGLVGASNGGLLAAAAVTQRPELWRAVASLVPVTDLVGFARDDHVAQAIEELGDPADPDVAARLAAVSPLHCVRAGVAYPATLVACVDADVRCPPWHSRVFVAAMQEATSSAAPICLRVWSEGSHMSHKSDLGMAADWLGFLMEQLDLDPRPR